MIYGRFVRLFVEIGCYAVGKVVSTGKAAMQWVKYCARVIVGKRKQPKLQYYL